METYQAIRGLAVIAVLGGLARIGMAPSAYIWGGNSIQELVFGFVASLLMAIGIIGVYLYATPHAGLIGFLGMVFISIGSILTVALVWNNILGLVPGDHAYIEPLLSTNSILTLVGQLVFSIAMLRARIYPVWSLILFILYPIIYFIPVISNFGSIAWGLCYLVFGYYVINGLQQAVKYNSSSSQYRLQK